MDARNESTPTHEKKPAPAPRKTRLRIAAGAVIALGLAGWGAWAAMHRGLVSTDDAQLEGEVVAVPARVGGLVSRVLFAENDVVQAGQVLVELDDAAATAKLAAAEAELASAIAASKAADADVLVSQASGSKELAQASSAIVAAESARAAAASELERTKGLVQQDALPEARGEAAQAAFDAADSALTQAKARLDAAASKGGGQVAAQIEQSRARAAAAKARIESAKAARDLASLEKSWTRVVAPLDGIASRKAVVSGQMVGAGAPVVMIVPSKGTWVVANFKETQIGEMHAGLAAEISIDAYPGLSLRGHVQSISGATGSRFALLPADNATGNFTKVVQRVPVRILLDAAPDEVALRPGMSAEVTVDVRG